MYKYFQEHYTDMVSNPDCAEELAEWKIYKDLRDDTVYGTLLALLFASFLVI